MDRDYLNKTTDTSQKVMDRIMNENRWVLPVHKHEASAPNRLRTIFSIIAIILLVGISVSFIFINPAKTQAILPKSSSDIVISVIKATDFAKTFSNLNFMVIQEGIVSSIGEPHIYEPYENEKNKIQTYLILSILAISMITLFMSWLSREENDENHT